MTSSHPKAPVLPYRVLLDPRPKFGVDGEIHGAHFLVQRKDGGDEGDAAEDDVGLLSSGDLPTDETS